MVAACRTGRARSLGGHLVRALALFPPAFYEFALLGIFDHDKLDRERLARITERQPTKIFNRNRRQQFSSVAIGPACNRVEHLVRNTTLVAPNP